MKGEYRGIFGLNIFTTFVMEYTMVKMGFYQIAHV
jgi:hypothetical protein